MLYKHTWIQKRALDKILSGVQQAGTRGKGIYTAGKSWQTATRCLTHHQSPSTAALSETDCSHRKKGAEGGWEALSELQLPFGDCFSGMNDAHQMRVEQPVGILPMASKHRAKVM